MANLLFILCLTRMRSWVQFLFTITFDSLLLWTDLKLLGSSTKDKAQLLFEFSSLHLVAIFSSDKVIMVP